MSRDNLKELWNEINKPAEDEQVLSEAQVKLMLTGKTNDIFSRISKNLTIGLGLLGIYVCLMVFGMYEVYFSEDPFVVSLRDEPLYLVFDILVDSTIIISFIYFVFKFRKLKNSSVSAENIKGTIKSAIKILTSYRRFFYYIIAVMVMSGIGGFIIGIRRGISQMEEELGSEVLNNPKNELFMIIFLIVFGLLFFGILITIVWFVFKKLYGNYIDKLRDCHDELIASEE